VLPSCVIGFNANDGISGGFQNVAGSFRVDLNSFNATDRSYLVIPSTVSATGAGPAAYAGLGIGMYFSNDNKVFNISATAAGVTVQPGINVDLNGLGLKRTSTPFNESILIFNDTPAPVGSPAGIVVKDQAFLFSGPAAANFTLSGCSAVAGIKGDPQFVGLHGQSYQVHGLDGEVYNLITHPELQVNAMFVFLAQGMCPRVDGEAVDSCWSHPGSYLGEVGVQQVMDGAVQQVHLISGTASIGFAQVKVNGRSQAVGDEYTLPGFSVSFTCSHSVRMVTPLFSFVFDNSDLFINQAIEANVALSSLTTHGLLGQTHKSKTYPSAIKHIEGNVDDYVVKDRNIFGNGFLYNRFQ
jgi:hypothetical protein